MVQKTHVITLLAQEAKSLFKSTKSTIKKIKIKSSSQRKYKFLTLKRMSVSAFQVKCHRHQCRSITNEHTIEASRDVPDLIKRSTWRGTLSCPPRSCPWWRRWGRACPGCPLAPLRWPRSRRRCRPSRRPSVECRRSDGERTGGPRCRRARRGWYYDRCLLITTKVKGWWFKKANVFSLSV